MAVQYAPMKLRVPPGFQNLLEGLAREILREQPEDIINFAAQHFKNQLQIRDETGKDDAKMGDQMEKLQKGEEVDIDLADPEVKAAATKIQASFRGHKAREDVKKHKDEEAAAVKIQAGFRGHQARERIKSIKTSESQEVVTESVEAVEADTLGNDSDTQPEEARKVAAEMAAESEKQEAADADQASDAKPDDAVVAEVLAVPEEPEVAESIAVPEPVEAESEVPDRQEAEEKTADVTDEGEAAKAQTEDNAEAAGESTEDAEKKTEGAKEAGDANAQPDGAEGGEVAVEGEAEQIDLDMNDPELQNAAVRIQASFRGHKAREGVKVMKSSESLPQVDDAVVSGEKGDNEKEDATDGGEDKGNDDVEPSVTEGAEEEPSAAEVAEDSKPSEN